VASAVAKWVFVPWSGYGMPIHDCPLQLVVLILVQSQVLFCAECNQSLAVPTVGTLKPLDHRCPLCQFQVIFNSCSSLALRGSPQRTDDVFPFSRVFTCRT
jgi:hypothetical protein